MKLPVNLKLYTVRKKISCKNCRTERSDKSTAAVAGWVRGGGRPGGSGGRVGGEGNKRIACKKS